MSSDHDDPQDDEGDEDVAWMDRFDSREVREARARMRLVSPSAPEASSAVVAEARVERVVAVEVLPVYPEADRVVADLVKRLPESARRPLGDVEVRNESTSSPSPLVDDDIGGDEDEYTEVVPDRLFSPVEGDDGGTGDEVVVRPPVDPDAEEDEEDSFDQEDEADRRDRAAEEAKKKRLWKCRGCKGKPSMTCMCLWCVEACGKCHHCGRFYSVVRPKRSTSAHRRIITADQAERMANRQYYPTGIKDVDRVLGGGFLLGNFLLWGGTRGAGKSTLLIQIAAMWAKRNNKKVFFASGEMTQQMTVEYVKRLGAFDKRVALYGNPSGLDVDEMLEDMNAHGAKMLIIDSIQYVVSSDMKKADIGTPAMIDAVMSRISGETQRRKIAVNAVCHLNKGQDYAGTQKSQHAADALVRFDNRSMHDNGEPVPGTAGLREMYMDEKSRQGSSRERALFEMFEVADARGPAGIRAPSPEALRALMQAEGTLV